MKRLHLLLLTVTVVAGVALGDVQLVLRDGRVLDGKDVVRKQNQYMLEISPDEIMSIPVELVVEVRLSSGEDRPMTGLRIAEPETLEGGDPAEDTPTGIRITEPRTLAGPEEPVRSPTTAEALEVFGEPAAFRGGTLDPYWRPKPVFTEKNDVTQFNPSTWSRSPVDSSWRPDSAFSRDSEVTDFNPVRWSDPIFESNWYPEDGFRKRAAFWGEPEPTPERELGFTSGRPQLVLSGGAATPEVCAWCPDILRRPVAEAEPRPTPEMVAAERKQRIRDCAAEVFRPVIDAAGAGIIWRLQSDALEDDRFAGLPVEILEGSLTVEETVHRAWFIAADGGCRLLHGERDLLISVGVAAGDEPAYVERIYNETVRETTYSGLDTDDARLEYALTLLSLLDPESEAVVVRSSAQFEELLVAEPDECRMTSRKSRRERIRARLAFAEPEVIQGADVDVVRLLTWSPLGGRLATHTLYLFPDGSFSSYHDPVADCIGAHRDDDGSDPDAS